MNALALENDLRASGVVCRVSAEGKIAVVTQLADVRPTAIERRRIVNLARQHGFISICLELDAPVSGA